MGSETIEGFWANIKRHVNAPGGTRDQHLQERIEEFLYVRENFGDDGYNIYKLLCILAEHGKAAKAKVETIYRS